MRIRQRLQFNGILFLCVGIKCKIDLRCFRKTDPMDGCVFFVKSKLQFLHYCYLCNYKLSISSFQNKMVARVCIENNYCIILIGIDYNASSRNYNQGFNTYNNWHNLQEFIGDKMKKEKQIKTKSSKKAEKAKPVAKSTSKSKSKSKSKNENEKLEEGPDDTIKFQQSSQTKLAEQLYTITKQQNKLKIKIHKTYYQDSQPGEEQKFTNWISMLNKKQKIKSCHPFQVTGFTYYPTFQFLLSGENPGDQKCSICQFEFEQLSREDMQKQLITHNSTDIVMLKCSHILHYECLKQMLKNKDWIRCPVCFKIFGKMIGDQPQGNMQHYVNKLLHCQGYNDYGTIIINYKMYAGQRQNISFPGTHRTAYLPDNKEGNQVLELLKQAFNRKLIFTIGRSVTTGKENQIVWNGIHHKTNTQGGSAYFGYPDGTYFERVKQQLAAKGVY